MIKLNEEEHRRIDPDAELVRHSPCNVCGRKSTARMRLYLENGLNVFAVCDEHFPELFKVLRGSCV